MSHDETPHQHTHEELSMAEYIGQLHQKLQLISMSEVMLRLAVLELLPVIDDSVSVTLPEGFGMSDDFGNPISRVRIFRDEKNALDILPA